MSNFVDSDKMYIVIKEIYREPMVKNTASSRINVRYKLIAIIAGTALTTALLIALLVYPLANRSSNQPANRWLFGVLVSLTVFIVILVSYTFSRSFIRRLEYILEVTRAWLRGNLSNRIDDPVADDLGVLADKLDQLAGQLEEDEQDLNRLSQSNTRLTDQVRALAVVEERNRLARELHDSVKQHLFSLAMTASAIQSRFNALDNIPDDLCEMADEIVNASQSAQRETTRLIEDLRPGSLEEQGLAAALNDYTLLFGAQEHIIVYLDVRCNDKELPPPVAEALYRVAQESLHNVARHAHATRVDVDLQCVNQRVTLSIEDNGVGFDTTRVRQGLGGSNMQERLLDIGGRLVIESQQRIGTTVKAEVHLSAQAEPNIQNLDSNQNRANVRQWLWLGQKLVIPVGQTWPWLPEDEERHLYEPKIMPGSSPLAIRKERRFLAIRTLYTLRSGQQRYPICKIYRERSGYTWDLNAATWDLQHIRGLYGRSVLMRNGQPLAAQQYQGRQMHTWTEIVYRTQIYNLVYDGRNKEDYILKDSQEHKYVSIDKSKMTLSIHQPVPLPLLVMTVSRFLDETSIAHPTQDKMPVGGS